MNNFTIECIKWIEDYFKKSGGENAVIGISGGKDSTVVAKLCSEALGKDHVIGVMMPNGVQADIEDSRAICKYLGIKTMTIDISTMFNDFKRVIFNADPKIDSLSQQSLINLAPRIRMTTLYGVAQNFNGRVSCNSNLSESLMGYCTLWGDNTGDFAPLKNMFVSQVIALGDDLEVPYEFVHKAPADGLTGMTDEDKLGFKYDDVESMFNKYITGNKSFTMNEQMAYDRMNAISWKLKMTNVPSFIPEMKLYNKFLFMLRTLTND